jgi:hypothetical protein
MGRRFQKSLHGPRSEPIQRLVDPLVRLSCTSEMISPSIETLARHPSAPFVIVGNRISIALLLAVKTCLSGSVTVQGRTPQIRSQDASASRCSAAVLISTSFRYAYR